MCVCLLLTACSDLELNFGVEFDAQCKTDFQREGVLHRSVEKKRGVQSALLITPHGRGLKLLPKLPTIDITIYSR